MGAARRARSPRTAWTSSRRRLFKNIWGISVGEARFPKGNTITRPSTTT